MNIFYSDFSDHKKMLSIQTTFTILTTLHYYFLNHSHHMGLHPLYSG